MKPTVIVFDAFGTLVEIGHRLTPYRNLMHWCRENGRRPAADDASTLMSRPLSLAGAAAAFNMTPPVELLASWEHDLQRELGSVKLYPDSIPVLTQLRAKGYRIGLCSNLAAPYGPPVKELLPPLDAYAWSYEAGAVKPDPAIYQYLLKHLGCSAGDVLFVGDTPSADVDGPMAFGMAARLIDRKAGQTLLSLLDDL